MCGTIRKQNGLITPGKRLFVQGISDYGQLRWGILNDNYDVYNVRSEKLYDYWKALSENRCFLSVDTFTEGKAEFGWKGEEVTLGCIHNNDFTQFAILTVPSSKIVAPYHGRMPLVLNGHEDYFMNTKSPIDFEIFKRPKLIRA